VNFDLSEEQQVVADLASALFADLATAARVREVERHDGFDRDLWRSLTDANLLGLCLPDSWGGSGFGPVELALMAEAQGRHVAPIPLVPSVATALVLGEFAGDGVRQALSPGVRDGSMVLTAALATAGANDGTTPGVTATSTARGGVRLTGTAPTVPFAGQASHVVVPALRNDRSVVGAIVPSDDPGVQHVVLDSTAHQPQADLTLDIEVDRDWILPNGALDRLRQVVLAANAALLVGVADGALALTAKYVSSRHQFGKPLASFQAVAQRAADAYITVQGMRATALNAAWRLGSGLDARRDVEVAAFWAADGGQSVTQACQHLHGGIGADVEYPVHRYFLWAIQIGNELGSASAHLSQLGELLATGGRLR
jgi:alkylation response protein AidB-like acyl-CoA dehydrogenase